jgi:hypothetical protein
MARGSNRRKVQEATLASAAYTSTSNILQSENAANAKNVTYYLDVTAVSGTTPTLAPVIQTSPDNGTTWFSLATAEMTGQTANITATGQYRTSSVAPIGMMTRLRMTIGGTTPSFTLVAYAIYEKDAGVF